MRIDDTVGPNVDPALKGALVVFNSTGAPVTQQIQALTGANLSLSPIQATGPDPIVKQTAWTASTGTVSVPARTVAVLVQK
jgi:hypothetical protein